MIDVKSGIIAGANVHIIPIFNHRPAVALPPILVLQNAVYFAGPSGRVGNLLNGIPTHTVDSLLLRFIADIPIFIPDDLSRCRCSSCNHA